MRQIFWKFFFSTILGLTVCSAVAQYRMVHQPIFLNINSSFHEISGYVRDQGNPVDSCVIYLFREQSQGNVELVDSVWSFDQNGEYRFPKMVEGAYYIQARDWHNQLIPTYYGDVSFWAESRAILLQGDMKSRNIELLNLQRSSGGNAELKLKAVYGSDILGKNPGDPAEDVSVILRNGIGSEVFFGVTQKDGSLSVSDLMAVNGQIILDVPGKSMIPLELDFSEVKDELRFSIEKREIIQEYAAYEIEEAGKPIVNIWPNPVVDHLMISSPVANDPLEWSIMDFQGKQVDSGVLESGAGIIDMSAHPAGVYFLKAPFEDGQALMEKIIKK